MPSLPTGARGRLGLLVALAVLKLALIAAIVAGVVGRPWLVVAALGLATLVVIVA
jgi:hypothetical protein